MSAPSRIGVLMLAAGLLAACTGSSTTATPQPLPPTTAVKASPSATTAVSPTAGKRQLPPVNAVFDYQIGGAYPPAAAVVIVTRDRGDSPAPGRYNICYVNAFQTQPDENPWWKANHDNLLLKRNGVYVEDPDWPGELILDTSTASKRTAIASIVDGWFKDCAGKGFQAIEPDNLDSWTRSHGLLSEADAIAYSTLLTGRAHARGLAIGQKNAPELGRAGKKAGYDFAIAEECSVYDECGDYIAVYGDNVIEIEYTDNPLRHYEQACASHGKRISVILRDRDVVAAGKPGYRYRNC